MVRDSLQTLAGKVAVVSGASSGIGAAIARELAHRGATVVINYPWPEVQKAAEDVRASLNAEAVIVEADLSTVDGPHLLIEATIKEFGRLDILVNNAAICYPTQIDELSDEQLLKDWERIVTLNGRGTLLLTRAALPVLHRQHSRIINISSESTRSPEPFMTIYTGTKGMVETFTRCWAKELPRRYGCTVNTVAPGPIATDNLLSAPKDFLDMVFKQSETNPVASRLGTPEEVAAAVAMLCEEKADWINGAYIPVGGGMVMT
ncbi:related to 3-oxoacyl-[acyl-carrier-protein] reductase [Fusarium torulosum]|uniref:Related to 3-oxoacyl-[acyl-carrier-protein] reductase n=1 Tax=Fusarium torulosum TaxID=33205 RepID=A0AAE8SPR3_9HYPO|nr:related to 3-oxoacyl-[acyl-carrier-protein] reductase [Fusarium torulosum]